MLIPWSHEGSNAYDVVFKLLFTEAGRMGPSGLLKYDGRKPSSVADAAR